MSSPGPSRRTLVLTLCRVLALGCALSSTSGCLRIALSPLPDTVQPEVDDATKHGFDGIIVYVDQPNAPATYTAGVKSRKTGDPVNPDALFKIGSISKLYVAAATVKLVHAGALSLDDTLAKLMPELAGRVEYAESITLRHMLQHRSGIPNINDQPEFSLVDPPQSANEAIDLVLDVPGEFKPNSRHKYSNTNYILIGEILDRALGYSHHEYVKDRILTPLGLENTYSLLREVDPDDVMSGYDAGDGDYDWKFPSTVVASGSMVASAADSGRFLRMLIDGTLFDEDEQKTYASVYRYGHTGLLPGYQSIARYHEDIDAVVVQFTNVSGTHRWSRSEAIYRRIVRILRRGG